MRVAERVAAQGKGELWRHRHLLLLLGSLCARSGVALRACGSIACRLERRWWGWICGVAAFIANRATEFKCWSCKYECCCTASAWALQLGACLIRQAKLPGGQWAPEDKLEHLESSDPCRICGKDQVSNVLLWEEG